MTRSAWQGEDAYGSIWSRAVRVWPDSEGETSSVIPAIVRTSLDEAVRCHRAAAYTASVVMAGRALEAVCLHFELGKTKLHEGLHELLQREMIDRRLWLWGDQLRKHRNLAAHASDRKFSREDATDLLDFANAICEYVFVLTPQFKRFMDRTSDIAPSDVPLEGSKE